MALVSWLQLLLALLVALLLALVALLWLSSYCSRSSCKRISTEEQRYRLLLWQPLQGIIVFVWQLGRGTHPVACGTGITATAAYATGFPPGPGPHDRHPEWPQPPCAPAAEQALLVQ